MIIIIITIIFLAAWAYVGAIIVTNGELSHSTKVPMMSLNLSDKQKYYFYSHIFGLFWGVAFLLSLSHFIITNVTCLWYFSNHLEDVSSPITKSVWIIFRYHLGSLAFGSLILAIVWIVRAIFEYLQVDNPITFRKRLRRRLAIRLL